VPVFVACFGCQVKLTGGSVPLAHFGNRTHFKGLRAVTKLGSIRTHDVQSYRNVDRRIQKWCLVAGLELCKN
jgi:hypothetical protein